jgi:sugar phosphate isomerase/epimerase
MAELYRVFMKRREFLQSISVTTALAATNTFPNRLAAGEPILRTGPTRLTLSLAAYSLLPYFEWMRGKSQVQPGERKAMTMVDFLDYCVKENFSAAELTGYFFPPDTDHSDFREIKRQAFLRGIAVSGTAIGNDFTGEPDTLEPEIRKAKQWIEFAREMGAPHVRIFAGSGDELRKFPERINQACIAVMKCAEVASDCGVFLGIENHGNLTIDQMMQLMERLEHPWIGINLDTGNFFSESPYDDLERCLPYAVNIQVKVMMRRPDGTRYPADLKRIVKMIKESGYQGYVVLEYEEDDPLNDIPKYADQIRNLIA